VAGGLLLRGSKRMGWSSAASREFAALGLALLAYGGAVLIHGNGFIAAFVAGLAFGALARDTAHAAARFSEETGTLLSLTVWFVFGAAVGPVLLHEGLQWRPIVYALLSLTVIRMVPVTLALLGKKVHWSTTLFIGWFGPRGLASVVFLLMALRSLEEAGIDTGLLLVTAGWTIMLSVILHGVSAGPVAAWYGRRAKSFPPGSPELESVAEVHARRGLATPSSHREA
jgi:NhaP-type Na+/H+ or K+/H+ antiporter